jgi:alpha-tubulin suppressor-like RCC1 family protein
VERELVMRALAIALATTGCTQVTSDFVCASDADCTTESGETGRCEPIHRCSYADSTCSTGFRYGELAGDSANSCTSLDDCVAEVHAGVHDTCVRRGDDTVWCWGDGASAPSQVEFPAGAIAQLDNAGAGLCARYSDGRLYCASGVVTGDISITGREIAVGTSHVCAITDDGHVACWGDNGRGELGDNSMVSRNTPGNVDKLTNITQLASGLQTSCAITSTGAVWCWGDDNRGQIGRGISLDELSLVPLQASDTSGFAQVAVGDWFTCGATEHGDLWCWGNNDAGQNAQNTIGSENDSPVPVTMPSGIVQVAAGGSHACARRDDGQTWCWGSNGSHETTSSSAASVAMPTLVTDASGTPVRFHDISAGAQHTCGRTMTDGSVMCWGNNAMGQVGDGTFNVALRPTPVPLACR